MLHKLQSAPGSRQKRKRVARGSSAGGGTTAGRGTKGQQARAGKGKRFGFEGGQNPIIRRQPKLAGFRSPNKIDFEILTLTALDRLEPGTYSLDDLRVRRLVRKAGPVKLLATGTLTKKVSITVNAASKQAKEAVKKAGGELKIQK